MMFGLDSTGAIAGNIFTRDCKTVEGIQKSLLLPTFSKEIGQTKKIATGQEAIELGSTGIELTQLLFDTYNIEKERPATSLLEVLNDLAAAENEGFYFRTIEYILTRQDKIKLSDSSLSTLSPDEQVLLQNLVDKINIYVTTPESIDATKNRIVAAIRHASSDLRNLKASEVPMEPGEIGARIEDRAKRKKQPPYWNYNPFTLWRIQKENAVGRDDVGIAANGLKAAGAIQQYFNTAYNSKPQVVDGETTWNIPRVSIDLNFSLTDAPNIQYRFRRFNNTKVQSSAQLANILGDAKQQPTYQYFTQLIGQSNWRKLIQDRLNDETIRNREGRFLRNVIAYYDKQEALLGKKSMVPQESDFIEISFEEMETEPNVADTLSVFISLATDNAKELKLSKMNGRPELLSIPIAMATLGMEVDDMIDVCVDLMDAIGKKIDEADGGYVNIREIIAEVNDPKLTPESKQSLLDLYDFAQELRALTTFFSVNQGVKAKLTELREFLNGLSRQKIQAEKNKGLTSATLAGKLNFKELVKKPGINGEKSEYQTGLITHYEGLKSGINVMDVIISSPHFRSQLESISETVDIIEKSTGKGRMMRLISEYTDAFDFKGMSKKDRIDATNRAIRMADSYILEQAFGNMKHLQFSKQQLIAEYPDYDPTINDQTTVGTQNIVQLKGLLQFVEHSLVPKLQEQFPDNFFLQNLTPDKDTLTGSTYLHLPFNLFATDESMYVAESVNMAMASFEEIAKYASGIKDLNGQDVSVGEFLYLYALVTSRNSISSMMTCTYSGVSKYSKLPKYVEEAYSNFDLMAQQCNVADNLDTLVADETITESQKSELQATAAAAQQKFNEFITKIYPYIYAQAHKGTYEMSKGKLKTLETNLQREATPITEDTEVMGDIMNADLNMHFSSKEFFLPTMDKGYSYDSFRSTSFNTQQTLDRIQSVVTMRLASQLGLTVDEIANIYKISIVPPTSTQMIGLDGKTTAGYRVSLQINVAFVDGTDGKDAISFVFTGEDSQGNLYMKNVEELILRIASNLKTPTRILQDKGMSGKIHRNTSLSAGISTDSANPNVKRLLDKIHTFITNPKSFVLQHNGRPSVHYINDQKIYIIGTNPLSNSDMVRVYLMDQGHLSENAQLIALIQEIFPDMNIQTIEDVHFLLKSDGVLDELKKTSSVIKDFILDVYENPATEYIKKQANIQLSKYQTALFGNRSIYFGDPGLENKTGDIYKDEDGDEWIHLLNDEDNHPVLVRFNGFNTRPEGMKETVKPIYGSFEGFTKVNTLVVPNTYILRSISPSDFSYQPAVEYRGDQVKVGDIITIKTGRQFFVQDIIHRRNNTGELSRHLVVSALTNTKNKTKLELKDPYDSDFVTMQSPEVSTDITYQSNDAARKIDISQLAVDDKKSIILKMSEGQKVQIGADVVMLKTVIDDFIITVNNEQYPISTIDSVYADSLEHIGFNLLAACSITPEVIVDSKEFANYPEFRNGYVLPRVAKRKNYGENEISIRAKGVMIGKDYYLGFNTDFLHTMPEGEKYRIGDLILFNNQGQQDLAQVVNVENGKLALLVVQHLINSEVKYISKTVTTKEARIGTHYRKSATVTPARVNVQESAQADMVSMSLKGKRMLQFLGDKFNTTVEIISDSRQDFVAKVENGKVIINTAKKSASESVEKFVATQAIHEFTHLMLAYLRAQQTDVYLSIMRNVNATLSADQLGDAYATEIQRLEENLVRQITTFAESGLPSQDLSALDISYLFTRIVNAFLGVKGQDGKSLILREQMVGTSTASEKTKAYKFFEFLRQEEALDNWKMDVNSIQHQILLDEIMENIMKCKITT